MEDPNLNSEKTVNTSYKKVSGNFKEKSNSGFGKSVVIPFVSGVLGATLTLGVCFGVPEIRTKLVPTTTSISAEPTSDSPTQEVNTDLISLAEYSETGISVASKVKPSIVGITVEFSVNSFFGGQSTAKAEGSGIIISSDGYILTNNHIVNTSSSNSYYQVSEANKVMVYLYNDETPYEGKIIGTDEQTDLAVIKIEKTDLKAAELGDSDTVQVGEFSMAVGNPLGLQSTVTGGLISAIDREVTDSDGKTYTLIQTDAAINSGNSGGALVNSKGQVIGINTLKLQGTGIEGMGFAIPINDTKDIYEQLIQYNKVKRPYIGIEGLDLDEKTASYNNVPIGIYVRSVEDFSAAQKAGIKAGDVIIKANGESVQTMDALNEIKNKYKIGDEMTLTISRDGKEIDIKVTLGEQP